MKLYIAGPMRGRRLHGFPEFFEAALRLREQGHVVYNPAEHDMAQGFDPSLPIDHEDQVFKLDLAKTLNHDAHLILRSDGLVLLPGWEDSVGARFEFVLAYHTGRDLFLFQGGELCSLSREEVEPLVKIVWGARAV